MKKNKKMFAILTLVAFMMTLVPALAFAGSVSVTPTATVTGGQEITINTGVAMNGTPNATDFVSNVGGVITSATIAGTTIVLDTTSAIGTATPQVVYTPDPAAPISVGNTGDILAGFTVTATNTAPQFVSATTTANDAVTITFDKNIKAGTPTGLTLKINGTAASTATWAAAGNTNTVTATSITPVIKHGDVVTLDCVAGSTLADAVGNQVASFTGKSVTNTIPVTVAIATATSASNVYVVEKEADIDSNEKLEYDIELLNSNGDLATGLPAGGALIVWVERTNKVISDVDTLTANKTSTAVASTDALVYSQASNDITDGKLTVKVASGMTGKVTVKAALVADYDDATGGVDTAAKVAAFVDSQKGIFGEATGEFTASQKSVKTIDVEVGVNDETKSAYTTTVSTAVANGLDTYNVVATVKDSAGKAVENQKVTMSANKSGVTLSKSEATTDSRGQIKFDVTAEKSATGKNAYMITISTSSVDKDIYLAFSATDAVNAKLVKAPENKVAVDSEVTLKVAAYDINGNKVTAGDNPFDNNSRTYAKLGDKEYNLTWDTAVDSDGNWVAKFTPAKVGTYDVTMALKNGKKVVQSVEVAEQGKVVSMELKYDAATINLNATTPAPEVTLIDAEGVSKTTKSGVTFAINGKGIKSFNSNTGAVTTESDDKYAGEKLTVTAVDRAKGVTAVAELTIAADAQSLAFGKANGVVGQDLNIAFNVVDANGNVVALGTNTSIDKITTTVTSKPEGATASATVNKENDLKKTGVAYLQVASNKEGTVKVQVMIEATTGTDTKYYTGAVEATFGKDAAAVNSSATLIIGSNTFIANGKVANSDVAPFIQNGRTFLPVRALAEALGATVEFDAATNVVTIKGEGITAQMTLGSAVMTVNDEVVTMDTAAFATAEGRTVVPVRFAAQALGYSVDITTNADGTTATVTLSK